MILEGSEAMHALITGPRGAGKSTLVRRVAAALGRPAVGFETKIEPAMADRERGEPVYIHPFGAPHQYSEENLTGYCKERRFQTVKGAFDRYAAKLLLPVPDGGVICFDELGFMESQETLFCDAVRARLDGKIPVMAVVKDYDFPFLNEVRAHENCRVFCAAPENRDALFQEVLAFMQAACAACWEVRKDGR